MNRSATLRVSVATDRVWNVWVYSWGCHQIPTTQATFRRTYDELISGAECLSIVTQVAPTAGGANETNERVWAPVCGGGRECFDAEEQLYESVESKNISFKGFIDGIIKVPKKRGEGYNYWIIDWKTSGPYGWRRDKKQDLAMTAQLILYKDF